MVRQATIPIEAGFDLAYLAAGGMGGAERIVFLHANGSGAEQFRRELQAYADVLPTVAVSLRGHGDSGLPAQPTVEDFRISALAADVAAVLDHLSVERAHVVGNSVGGLVAFELLATQPERVASMVTFGTLAALRVPQTLARLFWAPLRVLGRHVIAALFALPGASGPARGRARALVRAADPRAVALVGRNLADIDYTRLLRQRRAPWLLLRAGRDHYVNRRLGSTLQAGRSNPRFAVADLPGARHLANLDAPAAFDRAVHPFLEAARGRPPAS
jgi:3-oxoadipate enol-lactonase